MTRAFSVVLVLVAAGCHDDSGRPLPTFERMIDQEAYRTWDENDGFADGRSMRTPPRGTVPRSARPRDTPLTTGASNGAPMTNIPVELDVALLARGRADYEVYCAVCHGMTGDGESSVAAKMELRRPPSLVSDPARSLPAGGIYRAIDRGYGLMRPYAEDIPTPERRWGVVAYVRALAVSHETSVDDLPPDLREKANEALR